MRETGWITNGMARAASPGLVELNMRETGRMAREMARVATPVNVEEYMRETIRMTKSMARAATPILMVVCLKESSTIGWHEAATHSLMKLYMKDLSLSRFLVMIASASRCWG